MSNLQASSPEDEFVQRLKTARESSAVLKARLIALRSEAPKAVVFVFEGDDDKIIYGQWVRRICAELYYEALPCGGKKGARGLKNALGRDLNRLGDGVYFLVDRDYDDLAGFESCDNVFVTETYSIENYLVTEEVLENLLRDEFPFHARPEIRQRVVQTFREDYAEFLRITKEINRRIFIARRVPVDVVGRLPTSLSPLATVGVGNVQSVSILPSEVIQFEREPTATEAAGLDAAFDELDPKSRYRGKFAIKFFREWLKKLADEYNGNQSERFGVPKPSGVVRQAEFVLSNFASKSRIPIGLPAFVAGVGAKMDGAS